MKYLVIGKSPTTGVLEWNILDSKNSVTSFIKLNYCRIIERCNYSWKEVSRHILIFEIDPTYELLSLDITRPIQFDIKLQDKYK